MTDRISSSTLYTNAGVPHGSVILPTIFLIYFNDFLNLHSNSIHCYTDDSALHKEQSLKKRVYIASSINLNLPTLKISRNLFNSNGGKTKCCILGDTRVSHLSWNDH